MSKKYRSLIGLKLRCKILDYVRIAYYQTSLITCESCEQAHCDKKSVIFFVTSIANYRQIPISPSLSQSFYNSVNWAIGYTESHWSSKFACKYM